MAIPAAATMTQTDTMEGDEIEFSIGDPRWVMRSQADLYSNRELAVVREYSTNAFDANKEKAIAEQSGKSIAVAPIEVTLPSMMNPQFKVRDYGYGMSLDVLADVYTKFGTSTKRGSNDFNGMLGYGSKSAVAYSTQFTVTSISGGMKTVAVVTRKPDWAIVMKIVSQKHTTEPSGTEIVVPVHNHEEFNHKAMDFYRFWPEGTVKINGKFPEQHVGEKIAEGFYYSADYGTSYVVMGNVPYRIENPQALFWNTRMTPINFVAYVDNGQVEFTPSREDLKYTDLTKNTLRQVIADFATEIIAKAKSDIDEATTHQQAYKSWKKWTSTLGMNLFDSLTFKGDKFTSKIVVDAYQYRYGHRGGSRNIRDWDVTKADNTLFILDAGYGDPSSSRKSKAVKYQELKGMDQDHILFVRASKLDTPWVEQDGDNFVTWDALAASIPKAPRVPRTGGSTRTKGSWDMYTSTGRKYEVEIEDDYDPELYFYMTPGERKSYDYNPSEILRNFPKGNDGDRINVVMVGANRLDKFKRDFPDIEPFLAHAKSLVIKNGESLLTADAKDAMSLDWTAREWLKKLDAKKIDDPVIVRYIGLVRSNPEQVEYNRNISLSQACKDWHVVKQWRPVDDIDPFKNYPLFDDLNYYNLKKDTYLYLNAKYASRKDKK